MEGWIKIHRSIIDHWIFKDSNRLKWWIDLLFMANWEEKKMVARGHLITLKKGEMNVSSTFLADRWKVDRKTVLRFLQLLHEDGMISEKTLYGSINIVTICNYERYQCTEDCPKDWSKDSQKDRPKDTNKEYKEIKNIIKETSPKGESKKRVSLTAINDSLIAEKNKFQEELRPYVEIYGRDMMNDFFSYWTEPNRSMTRMRFQLERTWDTKRRVENWARRDKQKSASNEKYNRPTKEQRDAEIADLMARKLSAIGSH